MYIDFLRALLIITPVTLAGLVFIKILKGRFLINFKKPLDFNLSLGGYRIFGSNKTWLGVIVMSIGTASFAIILVKLLSDFVPSNNLLPYSVNLGALLSNLFLGLAYCLGELPNSFIKRRLGIAPGKLSSNQSQKVIFYIFDKLDSVLGVSLAAILLWSINLRVFFFMLLIGSFVHFSTDILMKQLKLK